jgi:glycosyltransferase involved in cell wall biosynthesis
MPSFNQGRFIAEAIESVLDQEYPSRELLVLDGGSTDGTPEIVRRYESRLAYWHSRPDRGQSDAMNQGFAMARGSLVAWLNSDDVLLPGALRAVAEAQRRRPDARWFAGNCVWTDPEGRVTRCCRGTGWSSSLARRALVNVAGPTSFFDPQWLRDLGPLDERLHYAMDSELWIRFARAGHRFVRIRRYLWALRHHPDAKTSGGRFADSPLADPNHPANVAQREQWRLAEARHDFSARDIARARLLSRIQRFVLLATPLALWDTLRLRGRHWRACFACAS